MNAQDFIWLADFQLIATGLLTMAIVIGSLVGQPAKRLALAWGTVGALALLLVATAVPGWSLWSLQGPGVPPPVEEPEVALAPIPRPAPMIQAPPQPLRMPPVAAPIAPPSTEVAPLEVETIAPAEVVTIDYAQLAGRLALPVYLLGSAATGVWLLVGGMLARRLVGQADEADTAIRTLAAAQGARAPRLLVSSRLSAAVAIGLRKPTIVLPRQLVERANPTELRTVLAHELAHLRGGDLWLLAALRLLMVPLWPNPFYWGLRRRVRLDQETLADAAAADLSDRHAYAEQLVGWAREMAPQPRLAGAAGLWEGPSQLGRRIAVLLDDGFTLVRRSSRRWRALCGAACLALAGVGSLVTLGPAEIVAADEESNSPADDSEQTVGIQLDDADLIRVIGWIDSPEQNLQQPVADASVTIVPVGNEEGSVKHRTDANGLCPMPLEYKQPAYLVVNAPGYLPLKTAVRRASLLSEVTVWKRRDGFGVVADAAGSPASARLFTRLDRLYDPTDRLGMRRAGDQPLSRTLSDPIDLMGRFSLADLASLAEPTRVIVEAVDGARTALTLSADMTEEEALLVLDERVDIGVAVQGDLSAWPARSGKPRVRIRQRLDADSPWMTAEAPIETSRSGRGLLAIFRGLVTGELGEGEAVEYSLAYDDAPAQSTTLKAIAAKQARCVLQLPGAEQAEPEPAPRLAIHSARTLVTDDAVAEARRLTPERVVTHSPQPGKTEHLLLDAGGPIVTEQDLQAANVTRSEWNDEFIVSLSLTAAGGERMKKATSRLMAERRDPAPRMPILVDGKVDSAPTLNGTLGRTISITGGYDRARADEIAGLLMPGPAGGAEAEEVAVFAPAPALYGGQPGGDPNTLAGQCVDAAGEPLAGVVAMLLRKDYRTGGLERVGTQTTDASGRFRWEDVLEDPKKHIRDPNVWEAPEFGLWLVLKKEGLTSQVLSQMPDQLARSGGEWNVVMRPAAVLRGKITRAEGEPLAGARVRVAVAGAFDTGEGAAYTAVSGSDGRYVINDLPSLDFAAKRAAEAERKAKEKEAGEDVITFFVDEGYATVTHPGHAMKKVTLDKTPGELDVTLGQPITIEGRVVGDDGEPLADVPVVVASAAINGPIDEFYQSRTQTGEDGLYRVDTLPPGEYRAAIYHVPVNPEVMPERIAVSPVRAAAEDATETHRAPDLRYVEGRVVEFQLVDAQTREPVPYEDAFENALAWYRVEGAAEINNQVALGLKVGADSRFRLRLPNEGVRVGLIPRQTASITQHELVVPPAAESDDVIAFPISPNRGEAEVEGANAVLVPGPVPVQAAEKPNVVFIEGRVVGDGGESLAGKRVYIRTEGGGESRSASTRSDSDGRYRFDTLPPGDYFLGVKEPAADRGVLPARTSVFGQRVSAPTAGETYTAPNLRLLEGRLVRFQLVDADTGEPITTTLPLAPPAEKGRENELPGKRSRGAIALYFPVEENAKSGSITRWVTIERNGQLVYRLPPESVRLILDFGWIGEEDGFPTGQHRVTVPPAGEAGEVVRFPIKMEQAEEPEKRAEEAPPSEYTHPIDVSGRVLDTSGQPIAGARVYLASCRPGYRRLAEVKSDGDGRYRFERVALPIKRAETVRGIDSGVFEVFATAEGHALGWRSRKSFYPGRGKAPEFYVDPKVVAAGDPPAGYGTKDWIELDITLREPQGFTGRVVDHRGEPIVGASLAIRYCDREWDKPNYNTMEWVGFLKSLNERAIVPPSIKIQKTDADGRFAFAGLPPDYRWEIELRAKGYPQEDYWVVTNSEGPERSVSKDGVTIHRKKLEVQLDATREVNFRILYSETGEPADRVGVAGRGFLVTTDKEGYAKTRLPAGEHPISLTPRYGTPYLVTDHRLKLTEATSDKPFVYEIERAAVADIQVVDEATGEPLAGVDVWWDAPLEGRPNDTNREVRGYRSWEVETRISHYERPRTDAEGRARILFPPGDHRIGVGMNAYPSGYRSGTTRDRVLSCQPGEPVRAVFKLARLKPISPKQESPARQLSVTIVDPDGRPVPRVGVEVRGYSALDASRLLVGELVEKRRYGVSLRADGAGRLTLDLGDQPPKRLGLHIKEPGYGPYWANWDASDQPKPIPSEFTARLERGWSVGGLVVDENGKPVAGARVRPSIEYKKRPGDTRQMGSGARATTAEDGSWRFDSVPDSYADVSVEITHPGHGGVTTGLARGMYELAADSSPSETIVMPAGLTVTGRVTDEAGQPIVGATVHTQFRNDLREATTDGEGRYRLTGCKPTMARLVVSAPGKAMDLKEVRIDPEMTPVNFVMQPGGKIRVRVVDENGEGLARARVFFQRWRGRIDYFEFDHVNQYANEEGIWEWDEAPLDEFQADICRPGGMQLTYQKLQAREEEYVFSPPPKLTIAGRVVDAETGEPIERFRVVKGMRRSDWGAGVDWRESEAYETTDDSYRVTFSGGLDVAMVRVEALGYQTEISREVKPGQRVVTHDFELEHADAIAATIVTPSGDPAAEAQIAVGVAGSQISIRNGAVGDSQTYAKRLSTDAAGRFELPSPDGAFQLVITHDTGFAHLKSEDGGVPEEIELTAWARLEGTFRVGNQPQPGVRMVLYGSNQISSYGDDVPNIFTQTRTTTGAEGRFVFPRVFPGRGRVGRDIVLMHNEGTIEVTSSLRVAADFVAGETTRLDLGGTGRPLVGRLLPPAGHEGQVLWNFALIDLETNLPRPRFPDLPTAVRQNPAKRAAWWKEWKETDEGRAYQQASKAWEAARSLAPLLRASVARDGTFRIDDVPPGEYVLSVRDHQGRVPGRLEQEVKVPTAPGGASRSDEPVNLGDLQLTALE